MTCLVTGAAGFIGSRLAGRLLKDNYKVTGIDSFTDYYPRRIKEQNLRFLIDHKNFSFIEKDITQIDLNSLLKNIEFIFHLSAQAGVRESWGDSFSIYTHNNIEVTQKLLEASRNIPVQKFIYASSSSVYGSCPDLPWSETSPLYPYSPYGVSKLAAEHLCSLYNRNYGVPTISLRLFTVYGPGQRPDMAFHRFLKAIAENKPIPVFGDGQQTRDFTYVDDIIQANISSMINGKSGEIYNIGGGNRIKLADLFPVFEKISQKNVNIQWLDLQKGDVPHTAASIQKAQEDLFYSPKTNLEDGLSEEWEWLKTIYYF